MRPWSSQAPIRSLPARPRVITLLLQTADRSTPRHPQGRSQQGSDRRSSNTTILAVVAVALAAHRRDGLGLGEPFGVADRPVLTGLRGRRGGRGRGGPARLGGGPTAPTRGRR